MLGIDKTEGFKEGSLLTSQNICFSAYPSVVAGNKKTTPKHSFDESLSYIKTDEGILGYKSADENTDFCFLYEKNSESASVNMTGAFIDGANVEAESLGGKVVIFPHKLMFEKQGTEENYRYTEKREMEKSYFLDGYGAGTKFTVTPNSIITTEKELWQTLKNTFSEGDVLTIKGEYKDTLDNGKRKDIDLKAILREFKEEITLSVPEVITYSLRFDGNTFPVDAEQSFQIMKIEIKKIVPDLMNLSVFASRVWGCDKSGKIYASKYKDPTNFEYFNLTSADSFTLETDTQGEFSASFSFGDHLLFFKEDKIHRITGNLPSNFRHTVITTNGVKCGAEKTLAVKDSVVYYVGTDGVYAFAGGEAVKISTPIGDINFEDGYAFFYKDVYYLTVKNSKGEELYGYDTKKRMWFKDGSLGYNSAFKYLGEEIVKTTDGKLFALTQGVDESRDMVLTLREFTDFYPNAKGTYKLFVLASLSGGKLKVEADFGFGFETVGIFSNSRQSMFEIPLKPNRGEKISLRLTLSPKAVLRGIVKRQFYHGIHK